MNNEDHSKKKIDQTPASSSSAWAKIVDRQGQTALPKNSDGTQRAETADPVDLTPEQLDDLELDRQLRMLGKMSTPEDTFVSKVVAQTKSESNPAPLSRPRLPVFEPSLDKESSDVVAETSEAIAESSETIAETSEAIAGTSDAVLESSESITESSFASSADDGIDSTAASLSSTEVTHRRPVALLALLATILFVGCFFGSMWWLGSAPEIAGSPATNASKGEFVRLKGISGAQEDSRQDPLEISPEVDGDANRFAADDALVEHAMDEDARVGSVAAVTELTEAVDEEGRNKVLESANNANSNPTLVDAKRKLDSAVGPTEDDMPLLGDKENFTDQSVADSSFEDPLWDSKFDWNLALQFDSNGVGAATLNGEPVQAVFLQNNAMFLLRKIAGELQRRVRFLENRLGSKVSGSIAVDDSKYRFDDLDDLDELVEKVDQDIAKLNVRDLTVDELMKVRVGYREGIVANRDKFSSINLAHKNLSFYTEDEAFTICSVLSASEGTLRDLAKARLVWEKDNELLATKSKLKNCIEPKDFQIFASTGFLLPPDPKFSDQSVAGIQNLGPSELQRMLQGAPSVELFRNDDEFLQAKDFVYSKGPREMQLRLTIDKANRMLNNRAFVVTEEAKAVLADRITRTVGQLRSLRRQGVGAVGTPLEPLRGVLAKRTDLHGLPLTMGKECKSDAAEINDLKQVSFSVGRTIAAFNGSLGSRDVAQNDAFRNLSIKEMVSFCMKDPADDPSAQKLKTIDQILQIDHARLRFEMIGALRNSGSEAALKLMVNKAKFDLEPEVRIAATAALADMEPTDIRGLLLEGLKYPWHVVAEHSAEALVRLDDQDAVPQLIEMLDLPHPHFPYEDNGEVVQQELVGINHMRNCLLCHAPSMSSFDSVRGLIPHTSTPLPPHYYDTTNRGEAEVPYAVRADVTYLEQDFSVVQPVKNAAPWPRDQRFDYVVQKKKLTPAEAENVALQIGQSPNLNRNAIIFALRELTGETPGDNSSGNWKMITAGRDQDGS